MVASALVDGGGLQVGVASQGRCTFLRRGGWRPVLWKSGCCRVCWAIHTRTRRLFGSCVVAHLAVPRFRQGAGSPNIQTPNAFFVSVDLKQFDSRRLRFRDDDKLQFDFQVRQ